MPFQPISKQQQDQMQNQGVNVSGGGGASFSDVVPGQDKKEKSSGQYANLQQYISANQPQAQAMGQKVAGNVEQAGQEATQKVEQFGSQKPSVQAFDPNQYIQDAPSLSAEQKQSYQSTKQTGGYTGPQQLEQAQGYSEAQKSAQSATDKAKMAGTETGQQELLGQAYAKPSYSQGQKKLDQVLLSGNDQARQGLSDLSQRFSGLYDVFNQKAQDVGAGINQANAQALANKQAIQGAESKAWTDLVNPLEQRAQQANIERPQVQQRINEDISDDLLLDETLQKLGLAEGQNLYDLNLASYITPNMTQLGVNDVANQQERQRYQALADLFQDPTRNQIGAQGSALNDISFNKEQFDRDSQARSQGLQQALTQPSTVLNGQTIESALSVIPTLQSFIDSYRNMGSDAGDKQAATYQNLLNRVLAEKDAVDRTYGAGRKVGRKT
jgi:hypothetical protein